MAAIGVVADAKYESVVGFTVTCSPPPMPTPHGFVERLAELSQSGVPFVCVTMVQAQGSTPQDAGSKMLVTSAGLDRGTVGGGKVELKSIDRARQMLAQPANQTPP